MSARWDDRPRREGPGAPAPEPPRDPYVRWAMHTGWRGFARQSGWADASNAEMPVRIIGHLNNAASIAALAKGTKANPMRRLKVPDVYLKPLPGRPAYQARYFTATLTRAVLEDWLLSNPRGLRWRLALELRDTVKDARPSSKGVFGPDRDAAVLGGPNHMSEALQGVANTPASELPAAIALVDYGCAFVHAGLATHTGPGTRVAALWDQGAAHEPVKPHPGHWPWTQPPQLGYGRQMGPEALGAVASAAQQGSLALDETAVYRSLDYLIDPDDARRRVWYASHGGHLLDVAAGWPDPLLPQHTEEPDLAARAPLVFVQLPAPAALDSSGASLGAHLLDATRYVMSVTRPGAPLVLSISYGGHAGPHDGSSLIEAALDELVTQGAGNMAVVLAAGNARESACHARREVQRNRSALLRVAVPAGDTTDSFVELWHAGAPPGWVLQLRVRTPGRQWSDWVGAGDEQCLRSDTAPPEVVAYLRHDDQVPNGRRHMGLLAIAPTAQPDSVARSMAEPGLWEIEARLARDEKPAPGVVAVDNPAVVLDAWIERDDAGRRPGTERLHFVDQERDDERGTLSGIATGGQTFVVGGFNIGTGRPAGYSSLGERGGRGPDLLAACEQDVEFPSILAAATRSGEVLRLNGTSVAAPVFARRLYNELASLKEPPASRQAWLELAQRVVQQHPGHLRPHTDS
jgi:hypothetical protein